MHKILIIEGQEDLLNELGVSFEIEGFQVAKALLGDTAVAMTMSQNPDLILLNVGLPGMDRLDVCRDLRKRGFERPIIMLAAKSEEIDRVVGLKIGADD